MEVQPSSPTQQTQQANFLDDVEGTGRNAPAERQLNSEGGNGFDSLQTQDFLEILTTQLQNQNPQNPMKQEEMIGQINQLAQLQQNESMSSTIESLSNQVDKITNSTRSNQFISLIGTDVSVQTSDGSSHSGQLEKVSFEGGKTKINVGGTKITSTDIQSIGMNQTASASQ